MNRRPRCASGHFLPATAEPGPCRCVRRTRPDDHADLWGQGLADGTRLTTILVTGRYL